MSEKQVRALPRPYSHTLAALQAETREMDWNSAEWVSSTDACRKRLRRHAANLARLAADLEDLASADEVV